MIICNAQTFILILQNSTTSLTSIGSLIIPSFDQSYKKIHPSMLDFCSSFEGTSCESLIFECDDFYKTSKRF